MVLFLVGSEMGFKNVVHNKDLTQLAYAILHIPMVLILLGQCFYCMKEPKCKKLLCEKVFTCDA